MNLRATALTVVLVPLLGAQGAPVVNAPVAPEAIYIGGAGTVPMVAVIDMNGFGQGTGDPAISDARRDVS